MMILQYGGRIRDCEEVRCIEPGDVVTVVTNQGRYKARSLVITAGSWTNKLTTPLGLNLPLTVITYLHIFHIFTRNMSLYYYIE